MNTPNGAEMTYTNSSLSAFRRCPRLYDLSYRQLLKPETDAEALAVGTAWHRAFEFEEYGDAIAFLRAHSPSELWGEKLVRLFAAYKLYWSSADHPLCDQVLTVTETETTFRVDFGGVTFEGQLDAQLVLPDGRSGLMERKSTGDPIDDDSQYWSRLRMATQPGIYSLALPMMPSVIVYDVMRKPTISPKKLLKKDEASLRRQILEGESAVYCGEIIDGNDVSSGLLEGRETLTMYGARLAKAIAEDPGRYFQRKEISRMAADYEALLDDLGDQVFAVGVAGSSGGAFYRNPDACADFGQCPMLALCERNAHPSPSEPAPRGYTRREHRHAELVKEPNS